MELSLPIDDLKSYVARQLDNFFPDRCLFSGSDIDYAFNIALERTEWCFRHITDPVYSKDGRTYFSHLHSDQYSQFLYYLSNSLWTHSQNKPVCDKLISLNKALNGMFFSYKGKLPDIFVFSHPVGSIIGNADYSDFLVVLQNVTINTNNDELGNPAPRIGKGVFLSAGAKIFGNKSIGDRSSIGPDTMVFNREIPPDSVVYRKEDGSVAVIPRRKECRAQRHFNVIIQ